MKQYAKIEKAEIYALKIPFKMDFTHAMASRAFSDSLILKIEGQGKSGFGEAIVRDYVSGEIGEESDLLKNVKEIIVRILEPLIERNISWEEGKEHLDSLALESHELPLLCAVETALLDIFCHSLGEDIYSLLKKEPLKQSIQYGGTLPMLSLEEILILLKDPESRAASILPKAVYVDGSYDSYLLSENITSENFSFSFGGVAEIIRGQGLGFILI